MMNAKAFTLLELLTVAAIVAIIAAFAIPSYMRYVTETKVNAMFSEAEAAKLAVQSQYLKNRTALSSITVDSGDEEYTTTNTDYVQCVTIQGGEVSVVGNSSDFFGKTIWITWTPAEDSGELTWTCRYSDDAAEYLTDIAAACDSDICNEYGSWSAPSTVGSAETVWYFGDLNLSDVTAAFSSNCRIEGTFAGCDDCFNFVNTTTEQRYMDFTLQSTTHNYAGELGGTGWGAEGETWTYDYTYTEVSQSCMSQTRTENTCGSPPAESYLSDSGCT